MADTFNPNDLVLDFQKDQAFARAAQQYGLDPQLLRAVAAQESRGNPSAVSPKGAYGVMQLMPQTAKEMGVTNPNDVTQNIMGGARYLKQQLDKYKDIPTALAAYNAGPGAVDKHGGIPPYPETQNYVKSIMAHMTGPQNPNAAPPDQQQFKFDPNDLVADYKASQPKAKPEEEGFFSKLVNHPVDTLVDNLPTVGGAIGGLAGAVGGGLPTLGVGAAPAAVIGATALGGLGEAARKAIRQWEGKDDYKTGSMLQDAKDIGTEAAIQGGSELLGQGAQAALKGAGKYAVRKAFGVTKGNVAPQLVEDLISTGANPNKRWAGAFDQGTESFRGGKAQKLVSASKDVADQMVDEAAANGAPKASAQEVLSALVSNPYGKSVYDAVEGRGVRQPLLDQIGDYEAQFYRDNPMDMGVKRLQALRRAEGSVGKPVFSGDSDTINNLLHANTEAGARQALESRIPGFADQNAKTSRMVDVMDAVRNAVSKNSDIGSIVKRYGIMGLPGAVMTAAAPHVGIPALIASEIAANPTVEATAGRALFRTGKYVPFGQGIRFGVTVGRNGNQTTKAKVDSLWQQYQGSQDDQQ